MKNVTSTRSLHLTVLRDAAGHDSTAGGVTSTHSRLRLVGFTLKTDERARIKEIPAGIDMDDCDSAAAPVVLVIRNTPFGEGYIAHLAPAHRDGETGEWTRGGVWTMAGGNFAYATDSRFTDLVSKLLGVRFYGALAVHDRIERR